METGEGALWCHIITLLCAAGDWISGWGRTERTEERREGAPLSPRPKSCRGETFARQKWRAFLWQRRRRRQSGGGLGLSPSLLPFVCLSGALSWPLQDHAAAWLISPVEGMCIAPAPSLMSVQKISVKSRREGMKSHLIVRRHEVKCAGHSDDTRAQLCGKCGCGGEERKRERRRRRSLQLQAREFSN